MTDENSRTFDVKGKLKLTPESEQALFQPQVDSIPTEQIPGTLEEINGNGDNGYIPPGAEPADRTFWLLALEKTVENFLSVKVWTIFVFLWVSAYLCYTGHMTSSDFATSNGSIISVVYALRESFKTIKIRQAKNVEELKKMKV